MTPFEAAEELMRELHVSDAGIEANPYRMDELMGRFRDSGTTPDRQLKETFLSLWEDPYNWFFDDLYTDRAVEALYRNLRKFADADPKVEFKLPSLRELFPEEE